MRDDETPQAYRTGSDVTVPPATSQVRIDAAHSEATPAPFAWKDLDGSTGIVANVRLGTRRITAKEKSAMRAGQVVRLDNSIDEPVEIVVGSDVVAYGALVIVDGRLAIQVSELRKTPGSTRREVVR